MPDTAAKPIPGNPVTQTSDQAIDLAFESHGLRIGIQFGDAPELAERVDFLPPGATPVAPVNLDRVYSIARLEESRSPLTRAGLHILADGELPEFTGSYRDPERTLTALEDQIERYVAEFSVEHLFVHAGVVSWRGRAIVIPGRSHAGKSTLVRGLVHAGATYYSDEFAVLDWQGMVHPYQRKLSLRAGPYGPTGRIEMREDREQSLPPVPVGLVALLTYRSDSPWEIETITGAAAIMAMCDHTLAIRRRPADTFAILGAVEREATVIQGTRDEAEQAISRLQSLIDG